MPQAHASSPGSCRHLSQPMLLHSGLQLICTTLDPTAAPHLWQRDTVSEQRTALLTRPMQADAARPSATCSPAPSRASVRAGPCLKHTTSCEGSCPCRWEGRSGVSSTGAGQQGPQMGTLVVQMLSEAQVGGADVTRHSHIGSRCAWEPCGVHVAVIAGLSMTTHYCLSLCDWLQLAGRPCSLALHGAALAAPGPGSWWHCTVIVIISIRASSRLGLHAADPTSVPNCQGPQTVSTGPGTPARLQLMEYTREHGWHGVSVTQSALSGSVIDRLP